MPNSSRNWPAWETTFEIGLLMPRTIRFHLDESYSATALADGLRRHSIDVTTTPEVGLCSTTDDQQLAFATTQGRVLFSHDDDFLKRSATGALHAGIIYCHQQKYSIGELIRLLVLIWEIYEPEEMRNRIEYL